MREDISSKVGRQWAQAALDEASDLRHDLAGLGLHGCLITTCSAVGEHSWKVRQVPAAQGVGSASQRFLAGPAPRLLLMNMATKDKWPLTPGSDICVGRRADCKVLIDDPKVGKRHCSVRCCSRTGSVEVIDTTSTNGTFVNGVRITHAVPVALCHGDVVSLVSPKGPALKMVDLGACTHDGERCKPASRRRSDEDVCRPTSKMAGGAFNQLVPSGMVGARPGAAVAPAKRCAASAVANPQSPKRQLTEARRVDSKTALSVDLEVMHKLPELATAKRRRLRWKTREECAGVRSAMSSVEKAEFGGGGGMGGARTAAVKVREAPACSTLRQDLVEELKLETVALSVVNVAAGGASESQASMPPRLVDLHHGAVYTMPANGVLCLGRRPDCDVVIAGSLVSSRHCVLVCKFGAVTLEDTSSNGTYINDARVPKGTSVPQYIPLKDGDTICLASRCGPSFLFMGAASGFGGSNPPKRCAMS